MHISGDFPDPFDQAKTPVIRSLVDLTSGIFDHYVISINRKSPNAQQWLGSVFPRSTHSSLVISETNFEHGTALEYTAPGKGLFHIRYLEKLGSAIAERCRAQARLPDLLIGHKLTIEGVAAARAASILGVPYGLSIQGDTDTKIMGARPDLSAAFSRVFHGSKMVFPFAPWALDAVEQKLGQHREEPRILPCPTDLDAALAPKVTGAGLVSAFHLKNYRRKNLTGMADAMRLMRTAGEAVPLRIIGGGSDGFLDDCRRLTADLPDITFVGKLERGAVRSELNSASAFLLPSLRESFGLVFIEALFAGTPVIYPAGAGIDGYFKDQPFAVAVDARDPHDIAAAVRSVLKNETQIKASLAQWQKSEHARQFQRPAIARSFELGLNSAI